MNRQSLVVLLFVAFSGCQTFMSSDMSLSSDRRFGEVVRAPFDKMIRNARHTEQILGRVYFDTDEASLSEEAKRELDLIAAGVSHRQGLVIVEGHADHVQAEADNTRLAYRRALAVAKYLKSAGVWDERLAVQGFGEDRPMASNWSDIGRAQNRRAVIRLLTYGEGMSGKEALQIHNKLTVGGGTGTAAPPAGPAVLIGQTE